MRFVIDETSWKFNGLSQADFLKDLESFLDLMDSQIEQGHTICYSENLFFFEVFKNFSFYELYNPSGLIFVPRHVQERIAIIFSHLQHWEDFENLPLSFDVEINQNKIIESAPSIAWAHHQNKNYVIDTIGCLVYPSGRTSGFLDVEVSETVIPLWFISDQISCLKFFRWIILHGTTAPSQMERFSPSAFPELDFIPGVFNGIKNMSKPYGALVEDLVHHLSVFSDYGKNIFSELYIDAPGKFGSYNLNVSDENGGTKSNSQAKKDHTRTFKGKEIQFWWHSKLEPDRDRIHIDPSPLKSSGKIIVGIFCRHLIT